MSFMDTIRSWFSKAEDAVQEHRHGDEHPHGHEHEEPAAPPPAAGDERDEEPPQSA
jgi:hypothetical protein